MLNSAVRRLLLLLVALIVASSLSTAEPQQRRPRQPNNNISNGLDIFGLWQPEPVRAILLLFSGKSLSKAKADELESELKKDSAKTDERVLLIGYLTANAKTSSERTRLRGHVLWMVENRPDHPATAEPSLRDLPDDAEANAKIEALWRRHLEMRKDDVAVLKNAEKFFFGKDPTIAEALILQIAEKEPGNPEWPNELAQLYRMFGIPGMQFVDPSIRAGEAYRRVLALTRNARTRETLAGDMADASFRLGDFAGAAELAKIHLQGSDRTAPQRANTILGRVALRSGDMPGARQHLIESAKPEAGKDVSLSGPTMILAKELLQHGEPDAVLEYLEICLRLWPRGENALQVWISDIKNGRRPNFGNLGF